MSQSTVFQRDLEAIQTFPRSSLMRILRHTTDEQLYEAVRHELSQRDLGPLTKHYIDIMTARA
jgi:hypothetical protein